MALAAASSAEHFFSETGWTESHLRGYRVEHSVWDIHPVVSVELNWDWERVYGPNGSFCRMRSHIQRFLRQDRQCGFFRKDRLGASGLWSPLQVLRERDRVRVISDTNGVRSSKSPSPQPSPGIPGEGAEAAEHHN
jgi:hypothetical protein